MCHKCKAQRDRVREHAKRFPVTIEDVKAAMKRAANKHRE